MYDVPWTVNWNRNFESDLNEFEESGQFHDNLTSTIESIIENPARVGRYKEGALSGYRQTHVEQHVIIWGIEPTVPQADMQDQVDEVFFYSIDHHDDMKTGDLTRNPIEKISAFEFRLPYTGNRDPMAVRSELFDLREEKSEMGINASFEESYVVISGEIPTDERDVLLDVLPADADGEFDDPRIS